MNSYIIMSLFICQINSDCWRQREFTVLTVCFLTWPCNSYVKGEVNSSEMFFKVRQIVLINLKSKNAAKCVRPSTILSLNHDSRFMTVPIAEVFTGPIISPAILENISFVLNTKKSLQASRWKLKLTSLGRSDFDLKDFDLIFLTWKVLFNF